METTVSQGARSLAGIPDFFPGSFTRGGGAGAFPPGCRVRGQRPAGSSRAQLLGLSRSGVHRAILVSFSSGRLSLRRFFQVTNILSTAFRGRAIRAWGCTRSSSLRWLPGLMEPLYDLYRHPAGILTAGHAAFCAIRLPPGTGSVGSGCFLGIPGSATQPSLIAGIDSINPEPINKKTPGIHRSLAYLRFLSLRLHLELAKGLLVIRNVGGIERNGFL